jgi:glycopeptide antibiotics resistance protein
LERGFWTQTPHIYFSIAIFFVISDEIHQHFVTFRAFQLSDIILDGLGGLFGLLTFVFGFSLRFYLEHHKISLSQAASATSPQPISGIIVPITSPYALVVES